MKNHEFLEGSYRKSGVRWAKIDGRQKKLRPVAIFVGAYCSEILSSHCSLHQKNGGVSIDWLTFFTMCTSKIEKHATVYVFAIFDFFWKSWFVAIFSGFMAPSSKDFVVSQPFEQPATTNQTPLQYDIKLCLRKSLGRTF